MGIPYNKNTINGILRPKNQSKLGNSIPNIKSNKNSSSTSNGSITGGGTAASSGTKNNQSSTTKDTSAEEIKYLKKIKPKYQRQLRMSPLLILISKTVHMFKPFGGILLLPKAHILIGMFLLKRALKLLGKEKAHRGN